MFPLNFPLVPGKALPALVVFGWVCDCTGGFRSRFLVSLHVFHVLSFSSVVEKVKRSVLRRLLVRGPFRNLVESFVSRQPTTDPLECHRFRSSFTTTFPWLENQGQSPDVLAARLALTLGTRVWVRSSLRRSFGQGSLWSCRPTGRRAPICSALSASQSWAASRNISAAQCLPTCANPSCSADWHPLVECLSVHSSHLLGRSTRAASATHALVSPVHRAREVPMVPRRTVQHSGSPCTFAPSGPILHRLIQGGPLMEGL